jgi:hypothetical protein
MELISLPASKITSASEVHPKKPQKTDGFKGWRKCNLTEGLSGNCPTQKSPP